MSSVKNNERDLKACWASGGSGRVPQLVCGVLWRRRNLTNCHGNGVVGTPYGVGLWIIGTLRGIGPWKWRSSVFQSKLQTHLIVMPSRGNPKHYIRIWFFYYLSVARRFTHWSECSQAWNYWTAVEVEVSFTHISPTIELHANAQRKIQNQKCSFHKVTIISL